MEASKQKERKGTKSPVQGGYRPPFCHKQKSHPSKIPIRGEGWRSISANSILCVSGYLYLVLFDFKSQ